MTIVEHTFKGAVFILLLSQLFFWFFPPGPEGSLDDLIFWYVAQCLALDFDWDEAKLRISGRTEDLVAHRWRAPSERMAKVVKNVFPNTPDTSSALHLGARPSIADTK
jgi:hypothetical protein